jgi:hypothetical protein
MVTLPAKMDKTNANQKLFAFVLLAAAIYGVVKVGNVVLPELIAFVTNVWTFLLVFVPLALIVLFILKNPFIIWTFFKTLSWELTKVMIKMDPLSVMDRYVEYLWKKIQNLEKSRTALGGTKEKQKREIERLQRSVTDHMDKAVAAEDSGDTTTARLSAMKAETDKSTLKIYIPIYEKIEKNYVFLGELLENWKSSHEGLQYTVKAKRQEAEGIRQMEKSLKDAEEYTGAFTEAKRVYEESVRQLEIQVSNGIAKIDAFEESSKSVSDGIKVEKKMLENRGLKAIEEYRKNKELFLPDFTKLAKVPATQDAQYSVVSSQVKANRYKNQ